MKTYLEELHEQIWEEDGNVVRRRGRGEEVVKTWKSSRAITEEEWRRVWRETDGLGVPVSVHVSDYGFRFSLSFMAFPEAPGAPCDETLLTLCWDHLTDLVDTGGMRYDNKFDKIWEFCRPYFDTEMNRNRLEICGLPPIHGADYYRY
jgi:hypothetical protein